MAGQPTPPLVTPYFEGYLRGGWVDYSHSSYPLGNDHMGPTKRENENHRLQKYLDRVGYVIVPWNLNLVGHLASTHPM